MDGLIALLIIVWAISRISKKNRQKGRPNAAAKGVKQVRLAPKATDMRTEIERAVGMPQIEAFFGAETVREAAQAAVPQMTAFFGDEKEEKTQEEAPDAQWQECGPAEHEHGEGDGHSDAAGCIGGSMEHGHEEPLPRRQQSARPAQEQNAPARPKVDAAQLRSAVVMSEILGRPLALRGRTAGR